MIFNACFASILTLMNQVFFFFFQHQYFQWLDVSSINFLVQVSIVLSFHQRYGSHDILSLNESSIFQLFSIVNGCIFIALNIFD